MALPIRTVATILFMPIAVFVLTACVDDAVGIIPDSEQSPTAVTEAVEETTESTDSPVSTTTATPTKRPQECGVLTGTEAFEQNLDQVPAPFPLELGYADNFWSQQSVTDTFDPCADLSWITLNIDSPAPDAPYQIMFFHQDEFLGVVTEPAFAFAPEVVRVSDQSVEVKFRWALEGEPKEAASGSYLATYTWNAQDNRLEWSGDMPPTVTSAITSAPTPAPPAASAPVISSPMVSEPITSHQ